MAHRQMSEILAELDERQRFELASLGEGVDEERLSARRVARRELFRIAIFFIERSWEKISHRLTEFSLEQQAEISVEEVSARLRTLHARQPSFAWGWVRSRMNAWLMGAVLEVMPDLLLEHSEMAERYVVALKGVDDYWFRRSPTKHIQAGYHTALGVACKWYGSVLEIHAGNGTMQEDDFAMLRQELRQFATFSMTMLVRTDTYLWDSAGATPLEICLEEGRMFVAERAIPTLDLEHEPDFGLRSGCPALRARSVDGSTVFAEVVGWVERVFIRYLGQNG